MTSRHGPLAGAVILAGGRSSRLGGVPKAALMVGDRTLLERTLAAAGAALAPGGPVAVVGPRDFLGPLVAEGVPVRWAREEPPFAGPAAALAAGLETLPEVHGYVLVLACDMPEVAAAVAALADCPAADAGAPAAPEGWLAVDGEREQVLAAVYDAAALRRAVAQAQARGSLENGSVYRLVARLELNRRMVPPGCTADVDTWADAQMLGVHRSAGGADQASREDQS